MKTREKPPEDADSSGNTGQITPEKIPHRKRGPIPGAAKLSNAQEVLKKIAKLYNLGKVGDPKSGEPPMRSARVNGLGERLDSLLAHFRWQEARSDKLRDEQFEKEIQEMREAVSGYREVLIAHGLLRPGSPSSQTH